jgi:hypothetical protein
MGKQRPIDLSAFDEVVKSKSSTKIDLSAFDDVVKPKSVEKKNLIQPVAPTGTKPSKTGFEPFQAQVDTSKPSVFLNDEQKLRQEQDRIGKRFETTFLNTPTEFGKVANFVDAAKKVKDTLPQAPQFRKYGQIPMTQPTEMTEGQRLGESLTKGTDVRELITDKLTGKKTGLQKQIEAAQEAFRQSQGDVLADQARAQSGEQPMAFEAGYENIAPLMAGLQGTVSSFYKIPRYIYDVFAIPQNLVADLADIPGLQANYENVSKGAFNPLGYLEYAGDYTKGQEEKWQSRQRQYDEDIATQLFSTGDFAEAGLQIYDNVIASAPSIAAMFVSGGAANAAKLGSVSSKIATALPFASAQNQALKDNENMPEWLKPVNAAFNGLAEILLEGKFGTTAILSGATKVIAEQGAEVATKSIKDLAYNYAKKALSKVQPVTDVVSNAMEEMATSVSQNIIARATGEDPNRGIMDGVADAGIVGGAQGAGASAIRKGIDIYKNKKYKDKVDKLSKQRDDIINDLDNEAIPDTIKEQLEVKLEAITEEINNTLDENREEIKNLPEESKLEVAELADKIETIKESLQNETISDTARSMLEEDLKAAEAELDTKFKVSQPTFDTEESIGEEIRESNKKFQAGEIDQATWEQEQKDLNKRAENIIPVPEDAEIGKPTFENVPISTRTEEEIEYAKNEIFDNLSKLEVGSVIENSDGEIKIVTEKTIDKKGNQLIGITTYTRQEDGSLLQMTNPIWAQKSADGKIKLDYNPHETGTNSKGERVTTTDQITDKKIDLSKENVFTVDENGDLIQINKVEEVEIGKPKEVVSEDVEAKKAEIEKRRQEELNSLTDREKESVERSTKGTPITKDNPGATKVGDKFNDGLNVIVQDAQIADNFDPNIAENEGEGYTIIDRILEYGEMKDGKQSKAPVLRNRVFNNKADADAYLEQQKQKFGSQIGKSRQYDKINAKYDAELAALEQQTKPKEDAIQEQVAKPKQDTDIETKSSEISPYGVIAADYLFTGGSNVILSTDYFVQALSGSFIKAGGLIEQIRNKYINKVGDLGNIRESIGTENYNEMIAEIRDAINTTYNNKEVNDIFDVVLNNATGFPNRLGNDVSSRLEQINEETTTAQPTQETTVDALKDEDVILSGLRDGFKGVTRNSFDFRGDPNIEPKISNQESFATKIIRKGKEYIVVGLRLKDVETNVSGRDGYSFAVIEDNGNLPSNAVDVLTQKAINNISSVYPNIKNPDISIFNDINIDENLKPKEDAIQVETAGQVPVQPEATIGEEVEQGKPEAKPKVVTEESIKAEEVAPAQQVEQLRADEQAELKSSLPKAEQYLTDGKVDRAKITDAKDLKKFDEIYDKYDKLITPLLPEKETAAPKEVSAKAKAAPKLTSKVDTKLKIKALSDLDNKIKSEKSRAKKSKLEADKLRLIEKNPSIGYVYDNFKNVLDQLVEKGLISSDGKKVVYEGKPYATNDFASVLHDGLLDQMVKDGIVDDSRFKKMAEQVERTEFDSEEDAELYAISKETDPNVIAAKYFELPTAEDTNFKDYQIMQYIGKIKEKDWAEYNDLNNLTPELRRKYIDSTNKKAMGLDNQAEELQDQLGITIDPSDFIDVILEYKDLDGFKRKSRSNVEQALLERYSELTGKNNITDAAAKKGFETVNKKAGVERKAFVSKEKLEEIGVTEEDIARQKEFEEAGFGELETPLEKYEYQKKQVSRKGKTKLEIAKEKAEKSKQMLRDLGALDSIVTPIDVNDTYEATGKAKEYLAKVTPVLNELFPNLTIKVYNTRSEYEKATGRPAMSAGSFHRDSSTIALNLELIEKYGAYKTFLHEAIHPIVDAVFLSNPKLREAAIKDIRSIRGVPGMNRVFEHMSSYKDRTKEIWETEGITEFVTLIANGDIDLANFEPNLFTRVKEVFNRIMEYMGSDFRLETAGDIFLLSARIKEAFDAQSAEPIKKTLSTVKGVAIDLSKENELLQSAKISLDNLINDRKSDANEIAKALKLYHQDLVDVAKSYIKEISDLNLSNVKPNINEFAENIGESVTDRVKDAWNEAIGKSKKRLSDFKAEAEKIQAKQEEERLAENEKEKLKGRVSGIKKGLVSEDIIESVNLDKISDTEMQELGKDLIESGEVKPRNITLEIAKGSPRALQPKEVVALIYYKTTLDNQKRELLVERNKLADAGDDTSDIDGQLSDIQTDIDLFDITAVITAQQQSLAFRLRRNLLDKDYNLVTEIEKYKKTNKGVIPSEVEAKFRKYDKQLTELKEKIKKAEEKEIAEQEGNIIENIKQDIARTKNTQKSVLTPKEQARKKELANKYRVFNDISRVLTILAENDFREYAKLVLKEAKGDFKQFGVEILKTLGVDAKKYLPKLYEEIGGKGNVDLESLLEKPTVIKGKLNVPADYIRDLVNSGITDINELSKKVLEEVQKDLPDATLRQVRDAITDYGRTVNPTLDDVKRQINEAKRLGRLYSQLEDVEAGKKKAKLLKKYLNIGEDEKELKRKIKAIEDSLPKTEAETEQNEKRRRELKKAYFKKFIKEREDRLLNKNFAPRPKAPKVESDSELNDLEAKANEIRNKYEEAHYENEQNNRGELEKFYGGVIEVATGIQRALQAGLDFSALGVQGIIQLLSTNPTKTLKAVKEGLRFMASEKYEKEFFAKLQTDPLYPVMKKSGLALQLPNSKLGSLDYQLSASTINKIWNGLMYPLKLVSPKIYERAKLFNPYRATERAYSGTINTIRVQMFKQFAKDLQQQGITPETDSKQYIIAANATNNLTFRGRLRQAEPLAKELAVVFFAPRKITATLSLTNPFYYAHLWITSPTVAKRATLKMATFLTLATTITLVTKALREDDEEDENPDVFNPLSADFMKLRIGNTRINLLGGLDQNLVFYARFITNNYKSSGSSKTKKLGENKYVPTRWDLGEKFFTNKFAPTSGVVYRKLSEGKGRMFDWESELQTGAIPIWTQGISELQQEHPTEIATFLTMLNFFGISISTYGNADFLDKKQDEKLINLLDNKNISFFEKVRANIEVVDSETGETRGVTKDEFDKYKKAYGDYIKNNLKDNYSVYMDMSVEEFEKEMSAIKSEATEEARYQITNVIPETLTLEIDNVTYKLTPDKVAERKEYIQEYIDENEGKRSFERKVEKLIEAGTLKDNESAIRKLLMSEAKSYATQKMKEDYEDNPEELGAIKD